MKEKTLPAVDSANNLISRDAEPGEASETQGASETHWAVRTSNLSKVYGEIIAVNAIDLGVAAGETFGFLGPNGAGKSTTIKMLCTLVRPTDGQAYVAGYNVTKNRDAVRRNIGLVFQEPTLDSYLSAEQNLKFHADLYGMKRSIVASRIREVLEMVGLWERRESKVSTFSGGMKRRLEIARGLLHSPKVLFLDEPTVGLDPQTRSSIWSYINNLHETEEITIFMTTHYMDEAEYCDRIAIMDKGQIVALGSPAELKGAVGKDRITMEVNEVQRTIESIDKTFGIRAELREGVVSINVEDGARFVPRLFNELDVPIRSISVSRPSLDDVFLSYTGTTIREAESAGPADFVKTMLAAQARR